jgi:hypothetical protein
MVTNPHSSSTPPQLLRCRCCRATVTITHERDEMNRSERFTLRHPRQVVVKPRPLAPTVIDWAENPLHDFVPLETVTTPACVRGFVVETGVLSAYRPGTFGQLLNVKVSQAMESIEAECRSVVEAPKAQPSPAFQQFCDDTMGGPWTTLAVAKLVVPPPVTAPVVARPVLAPVRFGPGKRRIVK